MGPAFLVVGGYRHIRQSDNPRGVCSGLRRPRRFEAGPQSHLAGGRRLPDAPLIMHRIGGSSQQFQRNQVARDPLELVMRSWCSDYQFSRVHASQAGWCTSSGWAKGWQTAPRQLTQGLLEYEDFSSLRRPSTTSQEKVANVREVQGIASRTPGSL